jgi:hypothetical protein
MPVNTLPAGTLSVQLPVIFCPGCRTQLATHIFVILGTEQLICLFCARGRVRDGRGHLVAPIYPASGWAGMGFTPALDPLDGVALWSAAEGFSSDEGRGSAGGPSRGR